MPKELHAILRSQEVGMARMSYRKATLLLDMSIGDGTNRSAAWEVIRAKLEGSRKTVRSAVQHVKPKIPGFKECADWCMGCSNWSAHHEWIRGARDMHKFIARNFGR